MNNKQANSSIVWMLILIFAMSCMTLAQPQQTSAGQPKFLTLIQEKHPDFNCDIGDPLEKLVLSGYGAVFVSEGAMLPNSCLFRNEGAVTAFQDLIKRKKGSRLKDIDFNLQPKAAEALEKVFAEIGGFKNVARNFNGSTLTHPRGLNDDWAMRTLRQTQCNWVKQGNDKVKCSIEIRAGRVAQAAIEERLRRNNGHMFRYAIPGGSQHHFGLAIDVRNGSSENNRPKCGDDCIEALNKRGWFRTVPNDPEHFTYLGFTKAEQLKAQGLKNVRCGGPTGLTYWIPDLPEALTIRYIADNCDPAE